jgi:hypothetical protein
VIAQAVADTRHVCVSALRKGHRAGQHLARRQVAMAFLEGDDLMEFWCAVAGLDPDVIREKARRVGASMT